VRHSLGKHKGFYCAEDARGTLVMNIQEAFGVSREVKHRVIHDIEEERLSLYESTSEN
jgi:hypothetical protein